jgi:hypothetical protein
MAEAQLTWHLQDTVHSARSQLRRHEAGGECKGSIGRLFVNSFRTSGRLPANSGNWPTVSARTLARKLTFAALARPAKVAFKPRQGRNGPGQNGELEPRFD